MKERGLGFKIVHVCFVEVDNSVPRCLLPGVLLSWSAVTKCDLGQLLIAACTNYNYGNFVFVVLLVNLG